jgi:CDP-diacylglycerol---glycerol-3-phosphate 3-phosphatidyltransferase
VTADGLPTTEALLPLAGLVSFLVFTMAAFAIRCIVLGRPRTPYIEARAASPQWKWCMEWWVWLWGPFERACVGLGISPNAITIGSTILTLGAAVLVVGGHLSLGGWVYLLAASLDLVDGRVARAQGTSSAAGAFLDSTLDRLSELLLFAALAVHFRQDPALYAALAAATTSVLVSYARARGEALGTLGAARVGGMQRAERVVLTGVPCALSPLAEAIFGAGAGDLLVGTALALLALVTAVTATRRSYSIWSALRGPETAARSAGNVRWLENARHRARPGR